MTPSDPYGMPDDARWLDRAAVLDLICKAGE